MTTVPPVVWLWFLHKTQNLHLSDIEDARALLKEVGKL